MHDIWIRHSDLFGFGLALIGLIVLSAFFSAAETGMMSLNRYRLRHLARSGNRVALRVQKMLERPDRLLGVVLIGNTFANICASSIATYIAVKLFGDLGILLATIILTLLILIFSEMTPKTLAALHPQPTAFLTSLPLRVLQAMLYPVVWLANSIANGILFLFGVSVKQRHVAEQLNPEELRTVVHESVEHDSSSELSVQPKEMLLGILDLDKMTVEDVMLPRNEIIGIDLQTPFEEIKKIIISGLHTRLPVYYGSIDKIAGILTLRDALQLISKNRLTPKTILKVLREPYFIPEGTSLHTQLHEFRYNQRRLALVVDEYGDILGLLTLQDILEEIVGELNINAVSLASLIQQQDDAYIIDGTVSLRELNKFLNWHLPIDGPKTVSGLVMEHLETIPNGEVCLQIKQYRIEVLAIKDNRIAKVKITVT